MRWSHGHVMLCVTCLLKLLVSKIELGTRALCRAVFFKRLHDGPFGCLEGPSLEVILHTVCLAGRSATASHAREGLACDATHGVKKRTGVALNPLVVPRISHSAGCMMARYRFVMRRGRRSLSNLR